MPMVTSQPGKIFAANTGEIQHNPMGFFALWKASSVDLTWSLTVHAWPSTAQVDKFFATPKPPEMKSGEANLMWVGEGS